MLQPSEITAVETAAFWAKNSDDMVRCLKALLRLPVGRVLLLYDRKSPGQRHVESAHAEMAPLFAAKGRELALLEVDTYDTAPRWRYGIIEALRNKDVQAVFVFPGDLTEDPTEDNHKAWKSMLEATGPDVLVLGDYKCDDTFKTRFDELIGSKAVQLLFPELHGELAKLENTKLRTEFFVVGRRVFEHFDTKLLYTWGTDPTVQLTLSALQAEGLRVARPLKLGEIRDNADTRKPLGQMHQILRYAHHLAVDRLVHEMAVKSDGNEPLRRYDALRRALEQLFQATLQALDDNRAELAKELGPK